MLGAGQRDFGFTLPLIVELVAQRLKIVIELSRFTLVGFSPHPRQFLTVVGRELCQLKFIDQRFIRGAFRLASRQLQLPLWRTAADALQTAFTLRHRPACFSLLLRQLRQRITDFPRPILLLPCLTPLFQQLAADLQDLLIQLGAAHVVAHGFPAVTQRGDLLTQFARQTRKIINNLLILRRALQRFITFREKV